MLIWSAYFIATLWEHCVLLSVSLHGATEQYVLFYTSTCLPHCPPRNCHLWRLPKFYILGQLLLKNKKREKKIKRVFILWAKQVKSNMCLSSTWKLHRNQDNNNKNQLEAHAAATRQPSHLHSPHKVTKVRNSLHQFSLWVISLSSHQCCQLLQNYCEFCNIPSGFLICVLD